MNMIKVHIGVGIQPRAVQVLLVVVIFCQPSVVL